MQAWTEKRYFDSLIAEIGRLNSVINTQPDVDLSAALIAMHDLYTALSTGNALYIRTAVQYSIAFWESTKLPADVLKALTNQEPFVPPLLSPADRQTAMMKLNGAVGVLLDTNALKHHRVLVGIENNTLTPQNLQDNLTKEATFNGYANHYGFNTEPSKNKLRQKMLEKWLNHHIETSVFNSTSANLTAIVNAVDKRQAIADLKVFSVQIFNLVPVNPVPQIAADFYNALNAETLSSLRTKALIRILENTNTKIEDIQAIANGDMTALQKLGVTNTAWIGHEQKNSIISVAKARFQVMDKDAPAKQGNQNTLNNLCDAFLGVPANQQLYSVTQKLRLILIFNKLSVTQQNNFLTRLNADDKLLSKIFHATSPEAIGHYLGIKSPELLPNRPEIDFLLKINRSGSLISGELNKYLVDAFPNYAFDPIAINQKITDCYNAFILPVAVPNLNDAEVENLRLDLVALGFAIPNNDLTFKALQAKLESSAELYNAIKNDVIYQNNPAFCNYLLSIPGFQELLAIQLAAGVSSPLDVVYILFNSFNESNNKSEFLASIGASGYPALAESFEQLPETKFIELKNKTRQEDLERAITPANPDEKLLKEMLRKDTKAFIEPLTERFLNMQQLIADNTQNILDVRNAIRLDQFTPQHASGKARELKKNLTDMVTALDKMDTELGAQHAQWQGYKDALVAAGQAVGVFPDTLADRIALIDKYIHDNKRTRVALQEFREENGLLSNEEAKLKGKESVLLSIQSVEEESQKHGAVKFLFTGSKATIKAVPIGTPPPSVSQIDPEGDLILGERAKSDLTKEDAYMPVLPAGHMYRMESTYLKKGTNKKETVSIKKEGNKVTLEQKPAPEGELEAIAKVVEWKLEKHKKGNPIVFNGDAKLVAKCVEFCLALKVPLEMIEIGEETTYSKEDRGWTTYAADLVGIKFDRSKEAKEAQEFVETPEAKARIHKSLARLKAYMPEAREKFLTEKTEESSNKSKNLADDYKLYKKKNQEVVGDEVDEEYRPRTPKPGSHD